MEYVTRQLRFDATCHTCDDVQRAAYKFTDRCCATVSLVNGWVVCDLEIDPKCADGVETITHELRKEILDQALRSRIKAETESVRNLILAHAFSRTGLVDQRE